MLWILNFTTYDLKQQVVRDCLGCYASKTTSGLSGMHFLIKALMSSVFVIIVFGWFVLLSYLITHRLLQEHFARFLFVITKAMGVLLCVLAVYVAVFS